MTKEEGEEGREGGIERRKGRGGRETGKEGSGRGRGMTPPVTREEHKKN